MRSFVLLAGALALAGCSDDEAPETTDPTGGQPQTCNAPGSPEGSDVGEFFPDAKLTACDGTKITLDEVRCEYDLLWVSVGAGWCAPCQQEAPELQAAHEDYAAEGVGVITVLFQGNSNAPATTLDCQNWTDQFSLTMPVYADPIGETVVGFDGGATQTPLNILINRDAEVLWSHTGLLATGGIDQTIQDHL